MKSTKKNKISEIFICIILIIKNRYLEIYQEAADLYGLIHARFILTPKGN